MPSENRLLQKRVKLFDGVSIVAGVMIGLDKSNLLLNS